MALRDTFLSVPPREVAGPRSSDRFAYQRDWALSQLLKLHSESSDYLILFDLHDDVLILDSEANPTLISFFQVKTRESGGPWTRTQLLSRPKGQDGSRRPSILGKLYSNKLTFPEATKSLTFVTNWPIDIPLADASSSKSRTAFRCVEVTETERAAMTTSLTAECGQCAEDDLKTYLGFEVSALSLRDHEGHVRGKLAEFLEQLQPAGHRSVKVSVVYTALKDEIERRNNAARDDVREFDDLPKAKGFGRAGFQALLEEAGLFEDLVDTWKQVEQRLNTEQISFRRLQALRRRWTAIESQRLDPENRALKRLMQRVQQTLTSIEEPDRLTDLLEMVLERVRPSADAAAFDDDDIRVVAMMRSYEAGQLPPPRASTSEAP